MYDFDLFVIGAGSGGVRAARMAGAHGARVAIAEKQYYGGTCVNVGCVPKKLMSYLSAYAGDIKDAAGYGWEIGKSTLDWPKFIERKNAEIKRLNAAYEGMLKKVNVQIYWGEASILDPHTILINGKKVTAERILIATGGKPALPPIEGAKEYGITSDDIFYLKKQPKKLVIIGVGYIGLEFASIFNGLGTETHVIYRRDKILNEGFDEDIRQFLHTEMIKKGIHFHPETNIKKIEKSKSGVRVHLDNGKTLDADHILFATGRTPNTDGLSLKKLGIETDKNGAIIVNKDEQTNIPSIYAVGDVTDRIALTPVALAEGHALVDRLYGNQHRHISYENIPSAIFTKPGVASVGLTEDQARAKHGDDIDIFMTDFRTMKMILADNDERNLMKLVIHRSSDKVIGLHMVGMDSAEIVQGFATAIIAGATKADFDRTIGIHPTTAEEFVTMRQKTR